MLQQYGLAARHLGQFNGQYLTQTAMPAFSWFSSQWIRRDLAVAEPGFSKMRQSLDPPFFQSCLPKPLSDKALRCWTEKEMFLAVLEELPHTVCHFDAFRRNLFARSSADGRNQTVAIDWAFVGSGPVGAELVALVWITLAFREVEASQARDLAGIVFASYLDGLQDSGWQGDPLEVRFAFTAATALRRLATMGLVAERLQPEQQSLKSAHKEWANHVAEVGIFIEELADEARELLNILS